MHRFTTEANGNKFLKSLDNPLQSPSSWQKNNEGTVLNPTKKSATARETMNALVLVRSRRLLQTRKIIDPFPLMVRMERDQPRIQNQVSIFICFIDFLFITEIKCQESYMEQLKKDRNPKAAVEFSSM